MEDFYIKLIPIILSFSLGIFLKRINIFEAKDGERFLRLVFYVTLPALILSSFSTITITNSYLYLPIIAILVFFITYIISLLIAKLFHQTKQSLGTFILGSIIMNTGFSLPFFDAYFGGDGVIRVTMFDLGNNFLIFSFAYFIAMKYSPNTTHGKISYKKFFVLPPVWAVLIGTMFSFLESNISQYLSPTLGVIGKATTPLLMFSLGLYFAPKLLNMKKVFTVIAIRMGAGLILGILATFIFPLDEISKVIVIISSGAPVGYNTLIFSSMENLDKEFAGSVVSISIFAGMFYIPILLNLLY